MIVASDREAVRLNRIVSITASLPPASRPPGLPRKPRARLAGADRRTSIVLAAKTVFATSGYDGAKTLQIANAAGVSEALVYRHFPSKAALYRAVLRVVIQEQDNNMAAALNFDATGAGLIALIVSSVRNVLPASGENNTEGMRLVFGSLVGDGGYARLIYRRARRLVLPHIRAALTQAAADGELTTPIAAENVVNFIEHVTSMIQMAKHTERPIIEYPGDDDALIADAVRFCGRGIGFHHDHVEAGLVAAGVTQKASNARRSDQ